ncbi:MAG: isoprenylcysteine carboxylmethyltransferase family protein [Dehalococcoidia bacterium]|nr:isoprenylcysteine carboxylmethyltransferase family protein [Dehalococcoidia bacterium]
MTRLVRSLLGQIPPIPFIAAVAVGWVLDALWPVDVPFARPMGVALLVAGVGLDCWSMVTMLRAGTSSVPARTTLKVVTWGPYAWSRNPIYVAHGLVALGLGLALWGTAWVLPAVGAAWWATNRWTVPFEESLLARLFEEEYESYSRRVGRWWGRAR